MFSLAMGKNNFNCKCHLCTSSPALFHKARLPQCETASAELPIKVNIDTSSQHCLCNDEGLGKGRPSILQLYPNYILVHVLLGHNLGELECQVQPVHFKSRLVPQVSTSPVLDCLDTSSWHCCQESLFMSLHELPNKPKNLSFYLELWLGPTFPYNNPT